MRLKNYILNEGRSKKISTGEALDIISEKCTDVLKNETLIYRGLSKGTYHTAIVSPSNFERKSKYTSNYYTLLMDNLPAWKQYPKRSKSIVCTTDIRYAVDMGGGAAYRVLPFNGSKIGVCPSSDLWGAFKLDIDGLDDFNYGIRAMIKVYELENKVEDTNKYSDLVELFDLIDKAKQEHGEMSNPYYRVMFKSYFETDVKLIDFVKEIFDPKRHKFSLETTKTFKNIHNREIWTDGTSVLINLESIDDVMKQLRLIS